MLRIASTRVSPLVSLFAVLCDSAPAQTPPPAPPSAASSPSTAQDAQKIVVTGTKRKQAQQETTQSVKVLSERDTIGMQDGFDVFSRVPNVTQETNQFLPTVRGIDGNGVAAGGGGAVSGASPRMSSYVDGVARTYGASPDGQGSFWDMAQVEIYRGAQSTQLGQNSLAGAIVQTTQDPKFKDEFAAQAGARNERRTFNAAVMANKALGEQWAIRFTAEGMGGKNPIDYANFAGTGLTADDRDELGKLRYGRLRFKTLYAPTDALTFKLTAEHERRQHAYPPDVGAGSRRRESHPDVYSTFDSDNRIVALNANHAVTQEWAFDAVLSQQKAKTKFGPPRVGNPDPAAYLDFTFTSDEIAFEPKLTFKSAQGRTGAVIGAFAKTRDRSDLGEPGSSFVLTADDRTRSRSLFADATIELSPSWDVLIAGRLQDDRQRRNFSGFDGALVLGFDERNRVFLPKLGATFHHSADASFSLVAYEGYNASGGGVSFVSFTPYLFKKETAQTVELVSRTQWLDRTLTANANLFFTQFRDAQISGIGPGGTEDSIYLNAAKVRTQGVEIDLAYQPSARTRLQFALGLLESKIVDFGSVANNANNGNQLGLAPRITANVGGSFEVLPRLTVGADAAFVGKRFSEYENLPENRLGSHVLADIHAQYRIGSATLTGYVNNVFDRFVQNSRFDGGAYLSEPRTLGVNLKVEY
jgi:iron complex outermembrane recepter protein